MDPNEVLKFLRLTYTGFSDGALLALIALGLVLVFKSTDVINFAHGEFMLLGGFVGYQLLTITASWGIDPTLGTILSVAALVAAMVIVGTLVERLILRPLIGEQIISVIMVTIGLSSIIDAIVGLAWGTIPQPLPYSIVPAALSGRWQIEMEGARRPLNLPQEAMLTILVVVILVVLLMVFFKRSKYGIAMRATADDQQAAMSMGISIRVVFGLTWSLTAVLAGIAGLLIGELTNAVGGDIPVVGLRAFPVIILGGLDSVAGAIVGGFTIAMLETYASGYIDPSLKNVVPYIALLIILMIKPYGLFGQKRIERV
ncbi:MAG: branched-chain amino acid ABC transporter permease [Chloroflexi bacterium]|jgi:branched-chain amino acid transport system permease protein|nr:MAG: inner-membrane translocator [Chloroflexi bacterium OLB13]MBW7878615.1 branched-chain amino acid ABC transporter permease [Anaerolineae bacterium]MCC6567585.1 branched-chain amino acid ABC transporter permease [Chloroflexota bacterium]